MNNEKLAYIASAVTKDRFRDQILKSLLIIVLIASPVIAMLCNLAAFSSWHLGPLMDSIKGGYFIQDPAGFLFQQYSYGGDFKGLSDYLNNYFTSLVLAASVIYAGFGIARWGLSWWRTRRYAEGNKISGISESVTYRALADGVYGNNLRSLIFDGRNTNFILTRDYSLMAVSLKIAGPQVLFENAQTVAGKLILPISASPKSEAVLEGEFLENFHVYASPQVFHLLVQMLSPSLLTEMSQIKVPVYVELAGPALIFVFRKADVNSEKELATQLGVASKLASQIEDRLSSLPADELEDGLRYGLTAYRARRLRLTSLTIRGWYFKLLLLFIVLLNAYQTVYGSGLNLNASIFQLWFAVMILASLSYAPATRRLKAHPMQKVRAGPNDIAQSGQKIEFQVPDADGNVPGQGLAAAQTGPPVSGNDITQPASDKEEVGS